MDELKHAAIMKKAQAKMWRKRRLVVFNHYCKGDIRCQCTGCHEKEFGFLTVDHVNNDGGKHRKEVKSSRQIVYWLIKNGFPDGYQILCYNCNSGRQANKGICPHLKPVDVSGIDLRPCVNQNGPDPRGVGYREKRRGTKKWVARWKRKHLGYFGTEYEAMQAVIKAKVTN